MRPELPVDPVYIRSYYPTVKDIFDVLRGVKK